ncbi:GvpL/GvpF family gas vesicle protein [Bradyrhizobium sp. 200]|uniref:GvpL/GvpF family gas vesicle protein n=1 Tax=Bradyrhizobium sp. 200 TaxID=2782665 RepID=UPI0020005A54|nr:GvpL/GvpF family gas vesicle protein [Bradyrhizobium sp. 200]UPJ53449.1 GvpL/GvpF family gas vesicle protein [Bradyrhizobium sp. 200]
MSTASYTYAVARPFNPTQAAGLVGVDGAAIHLVRHQDLVAVVSPLALADADETALRARLETLAELEVIARAHHRVVAAVAACTPTLPFRLATVHRTDDRVAQLLRREYRRFRETLDRFAGRVEVGVKIYVQHAGASAGAMSVAEKTDGSGSARAGRDYLRNRREQRDRRQHVWRRAITAAEQMDAVLAGLAVDRREHRTQSAELSAAPGENVFNAAYLVDAGRAEELAARAQRLGAENPHVTLEITGPWPPYSFADSEEGT